MLRILFIVLIAIAVPSLSTANDRIRSDSGTADADSSLQIAPAHSNIPREHAKIHRYSLYRNEIIESIWPMLDLRVSYPLLISLEIGVVFNLTATEEEGTL
ncbi:MAG TPA: hypothetical protein VLX68_02370 [Chitinivibrionales bacterium]|nr:hypothetical protein [Chitinivibrionales bacterium]